VIIQRYWRVRVIILAAGVFLVSHSLSGAEGFDEAAWRAKVLGVEPAKLRGSNIENGRFLNPWMPMEHAGFSRMIKWRLSRKAGYTDEEKKHLPVILNGAPRRIAALNGVDFILWVGHASFLIRSGGEYWLTDPVFSKRALLPARKTPPGMSAREVNELGGKLNVVISHNHYDHLDSSSIKALRNDARFFVPKGLGEFEIGRAHV
jgi:N-acyl-phosphatidylethanolamine-hydrolysing phospholipase D